MNTYPIRRWLLGTALAVAAWPAAQAQAADVTVISKVRAPQLELYESPDMNAPRRSIAVPAALGSDWVVTGVLQQFYKVRAGSAGEGWARRSQITVVPGGPVIPVCVSADSKQYAPTGSTAGIARNHC